MVGVMLQDIPILPFPCMLACEAGHFLSSFAVFAGFACKNSKTRPFVSAVGAKSEEHGNALAENLHTMKRHALLEHHSA